MALRLASNLLLRSSSASRIFRSNNKTALLRVCANSSRHKSPSSSTTHKNVRTMAVSTSDTTAKAADVGPRWDLELHYGYDSPNSKSIDAELDAIEEQCKALKAKYEGNMVGSARVSPGRGVRFTALTQPNPYLPVVGSRESRT